MNNNENIYIVYCHTNKINDKKYIGITAQNPQKRWGSNGCHYKKSPLFYNAIKKYGWDNFTHEILFVNLSRKEAVDKEKELINKFNSNDRNFGYNLTKGGDGLNGYIPSEETRRKMSIINSGKNNYFYGKRFYGEDNPYYGKTHSEQTRKLISQNHADVSGKNNPRAKSVYCIELGLLFDTITEASNKLNVNSQCIGNCCNNKQKTAGGYHWRYAS